ncbi:MAG: methylation-associated defense system helix-turn-helix domain-containing protein MAD1 [Candidatus Helarchaeota archaeon]
MDNEILTIKEVANYLKVNERTIYRMVNNNELPAFKVRDVWRFKKEDIERWIEKNKIGKL